MKIHDAAFKPVHDRIDQIRLRIATAVDAKDAFDPSMRAITNVPPAAEAARRATWSGAREVFRAWYDALDALDALAQRVGRAWDSPDYTAEARAKQAAELVAAGRPPIDAALESMSARTVQLREELETLAMPPRPQPADAAQEAALGNLRTDMRMVLDRAPRGERVAELVKLLDRALVAGDALTVWFLAGSGWVELALGEDDLAALYTAKAGEVLQQRSTGDQLAARRFLDLVKGPNGLEGVALSARAIVRNSLTTISAYRAA